MTEQKSLAARTNWSVAVLSVLLGILLFLGVSYFSSTKVNAVSYPKVTSNQGLTVKRTGDTWATFRDSDGARVNYTGVARNEYGWWRVVGGVVDFNYTGIAKNDHGWWRIENGKVNFQANGVFENQYGWWFVENGKVNFKYTGFADNDYGKWRIEGGKVNFKYGGLSSGGGGHWYFASKGKVDRNYDGIVINNYGAWYVKDGEAQFGYNGNIGGYTIEGGKVIGSSVPA